MLEYVLWHLFGWNKPPEVPREVKEAEDLRNAIFVIPLAIFFIIVFTLPWLLPGGYYGWDYGFVKANWL